MSNEKKESPFISHRVSSSEYRGDHKTESIEASINQLESIIGRPHKVTDSDFPDDDYKCDVCWGLKNPDTGAIIAIWSYKEWGYNDQPIDYDEVVTFSVFHTDIDYLNDIKKALKKSK